MNYVVAGSMEELLMKEWHGASRLDGSNYIVKNCARRGRV